MNNPLVVFNGKAYEVFSSRHDHNNEPCHSIYITDGYVELTKILKVICDTSEDPLYYTANCDDGELYFVDAGTDPGDFINIKTNAVLPSLDKFEKSHSVIINGEFCDVLVYGKSDSIAIDNDGSVFRLLRITSVELNNAYKTPCYMATTITGKRFSVDSTTMVGDYIEESTGDVVKKYISQSKSRSDNIHNWIKARASEASTWFGAGFGSMSLPQAIIFLQNFEKEYLVATSIFVSAVIISIILIIHNEDDHG